VIKMDRRQINAKGGFTLIELLLYVSIAGVIFLAGSTFLFLILQSRVKNQTIAEVEQQGIQVLQIITQSIRNAEGINSPPSGSGASSISIDVPSAPNDPTVFDLAAGVVRIKEGTGSPISLTSTSVTASDVTFENLSRVGTPGVIRIQFTLTRATLTGRNEYDYSKTFYGSASLR